MKNYLNKLISTPLTAALLLSTIQYATAMEREPNINVKRHPSAQPRRIDAVREKFQDTSNLSLPKENKFVLKEPNKKVVILAPKQKDTFTAPEELSNQLVKKIFDGKMEMGFHSGPSGRQYHGEVAEIIEDSGLFYSHKLTSISVARIKDKLGVYPTAVGIYSDHDKKIVCTMGVDCESLLVTYDLYTSDDEEGVLIENSKFMVSVTKKCLKEENTKRSPLPADSALLMPSHTITSPRKPQPDLPVKVTPTTKEKPPLPRRPEKHVPKITESNLNLTVDASPFMISQETRTRSKSQPFAESNLNLTVSASPTVTSQEVRMRSKSQPFAATNLNLTVNASSTVSSQETKARSKYHPLAAPDELSHDLVQQIFLAPYITPTAPLMKLQGPDNPVVFKVVTSMKSQVPSKVQTPTGLYISHKTPDGVDQRIPPLLANYPQAIAIRSSKIDEKRSQNTLGENFESVLAAYNLYSKPEDGELIPGSRFEVVISKEKEG